MKDKKKNERKQIDFHMHSLLSDGQNSVEELVQLAYKNNMRVIAITDHNHISICEKRIVGNGNDFLEILPACEFSTSYWVPEQEENIEVHVIGLWLESVDPNDFEDIFSICKLGKLEYIQEILKILDGLNVHMSLDEVLEEQRKTGHLGRHQICDVLIRKGYADNVDQAMDRFVGNWSPYYLNPLRFIKYKKLDEVVQKIRATHGIPILCHCYGYSLDENEIETLVKTFAKTSDGVGGIEVFYENYLDDPSRMHFLKKMAYRYRLFYSVASDRHRVDQHFATGGDYTYYLKMKEALAKNNK